ncbi:MAG TPA: excinuclease ABC subunit UvrC, partial [Patescibacteria group bacterium]
MSLSKQKLNNLPNKPGCYLFKNSTGAILYIGKAKNIKKRVKSYFQKKSLDYKTTGLVSRIADIDLIVTDNELEALLLESKLIRENKPKYNIDLKDSVRYAYLKITDEKFPRIITTRQVDKEGGYFGPYGDANSRETASYYAHSLFKIRTCDKLPKRPCLQYYIKRCDAPCVGNISEEAYNKNVRNAVDFLKGKTGSLKRKLKNQMKKYSDSLEFEKAKIIREQLKGLEKLKQLQKQKVALIKAYNEDLINYIKLGEKIYINLFTIDKGTISGKKEFIFDDRPEILEDFIRQYYAGNDIPDELILPVKIDDQALIVKYLSRLKKRKVTINIPRTGVRKKLLNLVKKNIEQAIKQQDPALVELQEKLNLVN